MYITLVLQNKHSNKITTWDGSWEKPNYDGPASEAVRSFYQFMEYYEPVPWIANNMTAEEFDRLYDQGQRIFWLEDNHKYISVHLGDDSDKVFNEYHEKEKQLKKLHAHSEYFDVFLSNAAAYMAGRIHKIEFERLLDAYENFLIDNDVDKVEAVVTEVYDAWEKRDAAREPQ